ncbi:MAG TPA: hypothetical protein DD733_00565 [Clostridiales bacterium]|jgi:transposase-like protein|nr:hypothetical protein [Clostridiales bacterium]
MESTKKEKKKHAAEERAELVVAYLKSGWTQKRWCKEQGIALSTLGNWLKAEKIRSKQQNPQAWEKAAAVQTDTNKAQEQTDASSMPQVLRSPKVCEKVSEELPVRQKTHGWTKVSVESPVREQLLLLQAGKFRVEIHRNTDMRLLSELLSVLAPLC